jgi:hypothetical protein
MLCAEMFMICSGTQFYIPTSSSLFISTKKNGKFAQPPCYCFSLHKENDF